MIDEGVTKYRCDWRRGPALPAPAVAELNQWRNRLHDAGLVGHYEAEQVGYGNVSVRAVGRGEFIISGTQTGHVRRTDERHFALVTDYDMKANQVSCEGPVPASSEALTHAAIYELDAAIRAIVHVHSAALWQQLKDRLPTTDAAVPYGTPEMAREFQRLYAETDLRTARLAVMAGHAEGIVAFGRSIEGAARRVLERIYSA